MTDDDDTIELPLLPRANEPMHTGGQMFDYARAAVLADRERRAEKAQRTNHAVYSMTLSVGRNGSWSCYPPSVYNACAIITLRWTENGRAWIDSEQNWELAARLRGLAEFGFTSPTDEALRDAADTLDGGV